MSVRIDRRLLLKVATLGLGALAVPGAAQLLNARGFTHNVASGEPGPRSVLLWTRYVPATGDSARLSYEVAADEDFATIVGRGTATSRPDRDHTLKVVATGLDPDRWYFYRFRDGAGAYSPVGRTRTLPEGPVERFRIGLFSCANLGFGWFNAYAHAAERRDLDLIVHVGDYLYEYEPGRYPTAREAVAGRVIEPASEAYRLADYRLRFAAYRADPDLQRLHQMMPMVAMWDDHETANDSWEGGAENHQPATEGTWADRKAASIRAYREWMPVSDETWQSYEIGNLATLFRVETRLTGRMRPLDLSAALQGQSDIQAALAAFRDGPWRDPARTLLGAVQERWLTDGIRRSVAARTRWQVLAQQTVMGSLALPPESANWLDRNASPETRRRSAEGVAASRAGLPFNLDAWDGYPYARRRLLYAANQANANLIVLSGDSHNAWAFDLVFDGAPAGVEFAGQSVTSSGYESYARNVNPREVAAAVMARNPLLKWADVSRRGYAAIELTPDRATSEWLFLETVRERSTAIAGRQTMAVMRGTNRLTLA